MDRNVGGATTAVNAVRSTMSDDHAGPADRSSPSVTTHPFGLKSATRRADVVPVTPLRTDPATAAPVDLDRVLGEDALRTVFQLVVDLDSRRPVAVEALVRGPRGSGLATPGQLFDAAARTGRVAELDRACLRTALRAATGAGLAAPWTLFLNGSPDRELPAELTAGVAGARPVVVDLTERALTTRPGQVLRAAAGLRARGLGVALDDLGADPAALALLPLLRPDVVKLDLRLLAARPEAEVAAIVQAVSAQAERDGTTVLAEGVETEEHLRTARALGATLGQGWLFGRPAALGDLLARTPVPAHPLPVLPPAGPGGDGPTPFAALERRRPARRAGTDVVEEALRHLERHALRGVEPSTVVGVGATSPERAARHEQLARRAGFALSLPGADGRGEDVRGTVVLGPHFAGAVLARPVAGTGEFDLVVSHDRALVTALVTDLVRDAPDHVPAPVIGPVPAPVLAHRPAVEAGPPAAGLGEQVGEALEEGRRAGTGTGLLVVGVDAAVGTEGRCGPARAEVVRRMRRAVRSVDRWLPVGPDLFAVLLTGLPRSGSEGVVERVADALLMAVETSMDSHPDVSVSIGASLAPTRAHTGAEAQRQALAALDAARRAGGHCARIWLV